MCIAGRRNTDTLVSGTVLREGPVLVRAEGKTTSEVTETGIRLRRPLVSPIHVYHHVSPAASQKR